MTGRPKFVAAGALLAVLLCRPPSAGGAVSGSPHDLVAQGYDSPRTEETRDRCGACHMPAREKEWNLVALVPSSLVDFSPASLMCFSCHDGTTLVDENVDASLTAFHPSSHGFDLEGYREIIPADTGLPSVDGDRMDCTTCHDPHDDDIRPFLRTGFVELCRSCHPDRVEDRTREGESTGNHPVMADFAASPKEAIPLAVAAPFRTPFPAAYPLQGGRDVPGVHWDLGGHLEDGGEGRNVCITCHAVHGDESTPPLEDLLSRDPVLQAADEFCEGCHRGERGDGGKKTYAPNPGGTTTARTYHPCDDDTGNGLDRLIPVSMPPSWPRAAGDRPAPVCSTCHRAHGAGIDTALLRPPVEGSSFCGSCHTELSLVYHHPAGEDLPGDCIGNIPAEDEKRETGLFCDDCHRAHNAGLGSDREENFVPLLRENLVAEESCTTCHPLEDPTCDGPEMGKASHFLGDPTLPETYNKTDPLLRREPWPESGIPSLYGGEFGQIVLCLSCHTFKEGAVVSGDKGDARFLLARAGKNVQWQVDDEGEGQIGDDAYLCTGCHGANPDSAGGGGQSHAMMEADVFAHEIEPIPPVTITPDGHINCDTCHLPHRAPTGGGYYILEDVKSDNTDPKKVHPRIDFTPLCHHCHGDEEY